MVEDPVCHGHVNEKKMLAKSEYEGETYYFCALFCKQRFDREPDKYIKETMYIMKNISKHRRR